MLSVAMLLSACAKPTTTPEWKPVAHEIMVPSFIVAPTTSVNVLLRLDTRTGQVWQIQWRNSDAGSISAIGIPILPGELRPGRFTLTPTMNAYNFILLDQEQGAAWRVQWNAEIENRFVTPIGIR